MLISGRQFDLVAAVSDGEITLSPGMVDMSPVIRAQAVTEAQRVQAESTSKLLINIPGTYERWSSTFPTPNKMIAHSLRRWTFPL